MFNKRTDVENPQEDLTVRATEPPPAKKTLQNTATIGPSIRISGDLTGDEDLIVQGEVEGTVVLPKNLLTIGQDGRVNASVKARVIHVEGKVEGDLRGDEQVIVKRSGDVQGNITAPRVTLEDGCRFKGSINMDEGAAKGSKVSDIKTASPTTEASPNKNILGKP